MAARLVQLLIAAALGAAGLLLSGAAAQEREPHRILSIRAKGVDPLAPAVPAFSSALRAAGIDFRFEEREVAACAEPPPDLVQAIRRATLVFAVGTRAALLAKEHAEGPVVFCGVANPVESGIAASFERPGGKVAGVVIDVDPRFQLELLKEAIPSLALVGVLHDPRKSRTAVEHARAAAASLGIKLVVREVSASDEVGEAFEKLGDVDAVWTPVDGTVVNGQTARFLLNTCVREQIAFVGFSESIARAGALLAFTSDVADTGRQAAELARRILTGEARPGETAIEYPRAPQIIVNTIVAERIRLRIGRRVIEKAAVVLKD